MKKVTKLIILSIFFFNSYAQDTNRVWLKTKKNLFHTKNEREMTNSARINDCLKNHNIVEIKYLYENFIDIGKYSLYYEIIILGDVEVIISNLKEQKEIVEIVEEGFDNKKEDKYYDYIPNDYSYNGTLFGI